MAAAPASSTIFYVGTGATCDSPTDHATLDGAVAAALAAGDDEIRLTRTKSHTNVNLLLEAYRSADAGNLVIAGGYDDCDDTAPSGRIAVQASLDEPDKSLFEISTSSIVFRDLELRAAGQRGIAVGAGSSVALENVWIHDCGGGASVAGGGALTVDAASSISHNETSSNGGGVFCTGSGSIVKLYGTLEQNVAQTDGGNLWLGDQCVAELFPGSEIVGFGGTVADTAATRGGGVFLNSAGLHAFGGGQPVGIRDNSASDEGGGIFAIDGTIVLDNVRLSRNYAGQIGGGIRAEQGTLLQMKRNGACPDPIDCSLLADNEIGDVNGIAISADDSFVAIENTMLRGNGAGGIDEVQRSLVSATSSTTVKLDGVGIVANQVASLFTLTDTNLAAYQVTATLNFYTAGGIEAVPIAVASVDSSVGFANSIVVGTTGFREFGSGVIQLVCVLVDASTGTPVGSDAYVGDPLFIDAAAGDIRQVAGSPSVDMCANAYVPPAIGFDAELQPRGFDAPVNPDGSPGHAGGLVDAGFDEFFPDNLIFADGFLSGDLSRWSANLP